MRTVRLARLAGASFALLLAVGCGRRDASSAAPGRGNTTGAGDIDVFVPCALAPASIKILAAFAAENPRVSVSQQVDDSHALVLRLEAGERPDVLLCVGDPELVRLEAAGLIGRPRYFCSVGMALVVPEGRSAAIGGLADLAGPGVRAVAMGAQGSSPGSQTRELLRRTGLWDAVTAKIVEPKSPVQLLRFAGTERADAAIAFASCLRAGRGEWKELDEYHELAQGAKLVEWLDTPEYGLSIPCGAAVVTGAPDSRAAQAFVDFLCSPKAQDYLTRSGLTGVEADGFVQP